MMFRFFIVSVMCLSATWNVYAARISACGLGHLNPTFMSHLDADIKILFKQNCELGTAPKYDYSLINAKEGLNKTILSYFILINTRDEYTKSKIMRDLAEESKSGNRSASLLLANLTYSASEKNGSVKEVIVLYEKAKEAGFVFADNQLGIMYFRGEGVTKNLSKARQYLKRSSLNNVVGASYNLGLLEHDVGNLIEARFYFKEAGKDGHAKALFNLAVMNKNGDGGDKSMSSYFNLLRQSADKGYPRAIKILGNHLLSNSHYENADYFEGLNLLKKAFESGDLEAGYFLAGYRMTAKKHIELDKKELIEILSILKIVASSDNLNATKLYVYQEFDFFVEFGHFYDKDKFNQLLAILVDIKDKTAQDISGKLVKKKQTR